MRVYPDRSVSALSSSDSKTSPTRSVVSDGETLQGRETPDVAYLKSKYYDAANRLESLSDTDSVKRQKRINNKVSEIQRMILRLKMQSSPAAYSFRRNAQKKEEASTNHQTRVSQRAKKSPDTRNEAKSTETKPYILDLVPKVKPLMKPPPVQENPFRQRFNKQIQKAFLNDVVRRSFQ